MLFFNADYTKNNFQPLKQLKMNIENKIRIENNKINHFIKNWQLQNEILNFTSLESFNAKFKNDFNYFLQNNNFSTENINLFLIP